MGCFEDAERVHEFLNDLLPVLKKHNAVLFGRERGSLPFRVSGICAECVDIRGVDPDDCQDLAFEIGPIYNLETVLFRFKEPQPKISANVFNPAGEIL